MPSPHVDPAIARLSVVGAALLWSTAGAAIKLTSLGAPAIAGGRALIAGVAVLALLRGSRQRWSRPVLTTGIAYALTCGLFVFANRLTTAANAIFIQNTAPVWVMLLSPRMLGERPTRRELISLPVSLAGCALFFAGDLGEGRMLGNAIALAAGVTYAVLIIQYRKVTSDEGLAATVAGNVFLAVALLPLAAGGPTPSTLDLVTVVYLGLIQQALAAVLVIRGLRGVSAVEGSLLILLEPILSPVWAWLLAGERVGALAMAGATLVIASAVYRAVPARYDTRG